MSDYYLGLYEKSMPNSLSIRKKLIEAKNSHFDFMEISIDETDEKLIRKAKRTISSKRCGRQG
jgi:L-ribulose-5-phosphate 3-epimerase